MSKRIYKDLRQGFEDAIAYLNGDKTAIARVSYVDVKAGKIVKQVRPADVKAARKKIGLTRDAFACAFGLSPATLRKWENGERQPTGAARALLKIIAREPAAVLRAIRD